MARGRKTGGRIKGVSKNKERIVVPEILPPGTAEGLIAEAARAVTLASAPVRTPKAVMLDAMLEFETLGKHYLAKADRLLKRGAKLATVSEAALEGHKYIVAAVECATKVAPYVHARLLAIESRGDMTEDKAPYVVRVPMVMADSMAWQNAVGMALLEGEAAQAASDAKGKALPHPAVPQPRAPEPEPVPSPVRLAADPKTGQITAMPPRGTAVIQPSGSQEWIDAVTADRRKIAG